MDGLLVLYTDFTWSITAMGLISALLAAGMTEAAIRTERAVRRSRGKPKLPWWRTLVRLLSVLLGIASAWVVYLAYMEFPVAPETPYAGPGTWTTFLVGTLSGAFSTAVIAAIKGHLMRNPVTRPLAESIPDLGDETGAIPVQRPEPVAVVAEAAPLDHGAPAAVEPELPVPPPGPEDPGDSEAGGSL